MSVNNDNQNVRCPLSCALSAKFINSNTHLVFCSSSYCDEMRGLDKLFDCTTRLCSHSNRLRGQFNDAMY